MIALPPIFAPLSASVKRPAGVSGHYRASSLLHRTLISSSPLIAFLAQVSPSLHLSFQDVLVLSPSAGSVFHRFRECVYFSQRPCVLARAKEWHVSLFPRCPSTARTVRAKSAQCAALCCTDALCRTVLCRPRFGGLGWLGV